MRGFCGKTILLIKHTEIMKTNNTLTIEEVAQSIADGHMGTGNMRELALAGMIAQHYGMEDPNLNQCFEIIRAFRTAVERLTDEA